MKKLSLVTILSLGLAFSPLCAVESKKSVAQDLSVADSTLLFGASANALNVETLSEEEMRKTEGEGFFTMLAGSLAVSAVGFGICKIVGGSNCKISASATHPF